MTESEPSLALDMTSAGKGSAEAPAARIAVIGPRGCTRDGSAETITIDCPTLSKLEREAGRLHEEIDGAVREAAEALGAGKPSEPRAASKPSAAPVAKGEAPEQTAHDLSVGDVMTRDVHSVGRNSTLAQVVASLQSGGHRHMVVVDEEGELVGVLSQRDIFFGPMAWSMGQGRHAYETALDRTLTKEVMHEGVHTIESGAPLQEAAQAMLDHSIGCLPVVDGEVMVGIVTESDLLELLA